MPSLLPVGNVRLPFLFGVVFAMLVITGSVALSKPEPTGDSNGQIDMLPFEMVRTVSIGGSTVTFNMVWEGEDHWRETRVSGDFYEVRDGEIRHSMNGQVTVRDAGPNTQIPGVWFADVDWLMGRYPSADISEGNGEVTVTVTHQLGVTEWVLDQATGIPVEFREIVDGVAVLESRATSVTLLSGEVVR